MSNVILLGDRVKNKARALELSQLDTQYLRVFVPTDGSTHIYEVECFINNSTPSEFDGALVNDAISPDHACPLWDFIYALKRLDEVICHDEIFIMTESLDWPVSYSLVKKDTSVSTDDSVFALESF